MLHDLWHGAIEGLSVVSSVIEELLSLQASISNLSVIFVEWFWNIEVVSIAGSHLVGVQVLLVDPVSSVPELAIALIPSGQSVRPLVDLEFGARLESEGVVTVSEVWLVVGLWVQVTGTGGRGLVVLWLVVWSSFKHGASTVASAGGVEGTVVSWDHLGVESSC